MEYTVLDLDNYNRKEHFEYFNGMDFPYIGVDVNVDITYYLKKIRRENHPFFLSFLYEVVNAANSIKELRRRIVDDKILEFAYCTSSHTVMKTDGTYCYCNLNCNIPFKEFLPIAFKKQEELKTSGNVRLTEDKIHRFFISSLPWLSYNSIIHPVPNPPDSNPRITWGKFEDLGGKVIIPVSILVNHALVDGKHISNFYNALSQRINM